MSITLKTSLILLLISLNQGFWFLKPKIRQVCYSNVGCFSNAKPFNNARGILPDSPERIRTTFRLYTRQSKKTAKILNPYDSSTILKSNLAASRLTIFITHGFRSTAKSGWDDLNIITVDWSYGTKGLIYRKSAANTRVVGATIGNMVRALWDTAKVKLDRIHLVGHSLGAHIMGYAGDWIRHKIKIGNIGRISGLDPAGLYFESFNIKVKLDPSDANFVDVIHTNADSLLRLGFGIGTPNGHVDFYPNGGKQQPGCRSLKVGCSHKRAVQYFTESINSSCKFKAFPCKDYKAFSSGRCKPCHNGCNRIGYHASKEMPGTFYLKTNSYHPFCKKSKKSPLSPKNNTLTHRH